MSASKNEKGQDLRDFTVIIRTEKGIFGTGFAVSSDGKIVTCAHVLREALGKHPREINDETVDIIFPKLDKKKTHPAKLIGCFPEHDDDVVLLQLIGTMPLAPEQIAVIGTGDACDKHDFQSRGFQKDKQSVANALGTIEGDMDDFSGVSLHADEIGLNSTGIVPGMSGAAVLDDSRNLVVGVVSHNLQTRDDQAKAVNARVLSLAPLELPLYEGDVYPRKKLDKPNQDSRNTPAPMGTSLNYTPTVLENWVGRADLLAKIGQIYKDEDKRIVGMVGFGGEGKTSLARKWLEAFMQNHPAVPVFWWSFYENRNSDEFLSAFLTFLGGEALSKETNSATGKANHIGSLLEKHQILFVLDGFEVMQHEEDFDYGTIRSRDMFLMLSLAARHESRSFGLITTRAPMLDLQPLNTYQHLDISRLSEADGRDLLTKIGVKGSDEAMNKLINAWEGHALTLSLIGNYLFEKFEGDISHINDIPEPKPDEEFYARVTKVLVRYDKFMTEAEKSFMQIFSAFRLPVEESAFDIVFRTATNSQINAPLLPLEDAAFNELIDTLVKRGLLRKNIEEGEAVYSTHPLIRAHYAQSLQGDTETHRAIAEHYQANAPEIKQRRVPTLQELQPYIEIVYHLCLAGAYDEAIDIVWQRIYRGNEFVIYHKLGAYETDLTILLGFFPKGNCNEDPLVSKATDKSFLINEVAFCLQNLGRMAEVVPLYLRANHIDEINQSWRNESQGYQNLAQLSWLLGKLADAQAFAKQSLDIVQKIPADSERKEMERNSFAYLAWAKAQQNQFEDEAGALALFKVAEKLEQEFDSTKQYLYSQRGVRYAISLRRKVDFAYARVVTEVNLEISLRNNWLHIVSQCYHVLGDLDAEQNQFESAQKHYNEAIRLALMIDKLDIRIEAWIARGLFYAKYRKDGQAAFADLEQAMKPITDSGYRIFEARCRVAFAWAYKHLPNPDIARAKQEAERALAMSIEMGYAWGKEDAEEVLKALEA